MTVLERGAAVTLTARQAAMLAPLRVHIVGAWKRSGIVPPGLVELLDELAEAARMAGMDLATSAGSASTSASVPSLVVPVARRHGLSVGEVAGVLGCTTRHVRGLLADGVLVGEHAGPGTHWRVDADSVAAYRADRREAS